MKIEFNSKYFIENSNGVSANEEILNIISSFLDEKRYKHCLSVGTLAYKIAISNNLKDPIKYYFAGIVHDIGKNLDNNSEYINKYLSEEEKKYPKYIPQNKVKQIHKSTKERLERKYSKLPKKEKNIKIKIRGVYENKIINFNHNRNVYAGSCSGGYFCR